MKLLNFKKRKEEKELLHLAEETAGAVEHIRNTFDRKDWYLCGRRVNVEGTQLPHSNNFIDVDDDTRVFISNLSTVLKKYSMSTQLKWWKLFMKLLVSNNQIHELFFTVRMFQRRADTPCLTAFMLSVSTGLFDHINSVETFYETDYSHAVPNGRAFTYPIPREYHNYRFDLRQIVEIDDFVIERLLATRSNHMHDKDFASAVWIALVSTGCYTRRYPLIRYLLLRDGKEGSDTSRTRKCSRMLAKHFIGIDEDAITAWVMNSTYLRNHDSAFEYDSYRFVKQVIYYYGKEDGRYQLVKDLFVQVDLRLRDAARYWRVEPVMIHNYG